PGPRAAVLDRERGRRRPRAPDPGAARPPDDPREEGPLRGPPRGDRRGHRSQPGRAVQHPRDAQARHDRHGGGTTHADPAVRPGARRQGQLSPRRRDRRRGRDHDAPPAAGAHDRGPDPLGPRVLALLGADPRQARAPRAPGRPDHAPGAGQSRRRAVARGRRRAVLGHPRPGLAGGGRAHGRAAPPGRPQGRRRRMSLLIRNGRVVDPANAVDAVQDVLIADGKIARVGRSLAAPADVEVVDASGKIVCPGFIDMHVHLREPGYEYKETVATGTRAAAAGGFTAVCCMANTNPVNDNGAVTDYIRAKATGAHVHIAHVSTAGAVRLIRDAKVRGVRATAEVTPHHLVLTEEAVRSWDPNTKMVPPLRTKRDVEALIEALADGTVDCIA